MGSVSLRPVNQTDSSSETIIHQEGRIHTRDEQHSKMSAHCEVVLELNREANHNILEALGGLPKQGKVVRDEF